MGRCPALFRMDGVPPYVLWEEVIKDYLEICTPEQLFRVIGSFPIEVSKLVPELKQKLRTFPQSFPLSPEHSRDRLFEAVSQFITNISKESPLLVILDDLQWTDQSSLLLLHYLARGVSKDSLLLLGAYRHTYIEKGHPLSPVLTELNRERLLQSVSLKRLPYDDVSEMIKRILGQDEVQETFRKLIYEKTRGNPFFVEEVIKSLKEEEVIYREKNEWRFKEVSRIEFPETVKDVIKTRIGRLDDECQHVLTMASVAGKDFTFEALLGVTGFEEDRLLELMEKILKTGLIVEKVIRGEGLYSFTDIIVRDVVYDEISFLRRKKLHGTVGHALEKIYTEDINEHLGELASHFLKSGDSEKALDYFLKAGEKATKVYANAEAASYLKSAYTLLEKKDGELREKAQVLEQLGNIKRLIGEHDDCMKFWNKALLLRVQLHEKRKEADLHRKMANVLWETMSQSKKAEEHHNKALETLAAEPESIELASMFEDMAHMYYRTGEMTKALSQAEKALELAEKLNSLEVISSSYASLGTIFTYTGEVKKGLECHEKALKLALDNDYLETALRVYTNLTNFLLYEENERRWKYLQSGFELAKKAGHISFQAWIGTLLGYMWVGKGDVEKALLLLEESVALDKKSNNLTHLPLSLGGLGLIHLTLGEWDKAESYLNEALNISLGLNDFQSLRYSYAFLGYIQIEKEEYAKAKKLLEEAHRGIEKAGFKPEQLGYLPYLISAYIELGEATKALQYINSLHKFGLSTGDKEHIITADILKA
ncbi:tetratricopeptide repeat protein, partial [Candidatus Bathyarchaeota archaeon]|nr:tetratricopeptide repeat protein [Candidatus Bathyarchaeota archaeon]